MEPEAALGLLGNRGSWRQYPAYARLAAERVGSESRYLVMFRDGTPFALANLRLKAIPLLGRTALVSHGPVLLGDTTRGPDDLADAIGLLQGLEGVGDVMIDPDPAWCLDGIDLKTLPGLEPEPAPRHYRSIYLDISDDLDKLRQAFAPKWRGHLNRGEREGLEVRVSDRPADFLAMAPLLSDLTERKGFAVAQDCAFFARVAEACTGGETFLVHSVHRDGELLSAHIGAYSGRFATYLLGATSARGRDLRAAYVAQWAVIQTARNRGIGWYDLGGIDPVLNENVYHFKVRMGGLDITTPGGMAVARPGLRPRLLRAARRLYQRYR